MNKSVVIRLFACLFCLVFVCQISSAAKPIVLKKNGIKIILSEKEDEPIRRAVSDLNRDFIKVMRTSPLVRSTVTRDKSVQVIVVNEASGALQVDGSKLKELDCFESHRVYADAGENKIYLHGKDMRGTIYAIYSFSELILGVPPLWYFSSWVPDVRAKIEVPADFDYFQKSPQVKYRAWFPNDQDLVTPWKRISEANDNSILEAMLRSKFNCLELDRSVWYPNTISNYTKKVRDFGLIVTSHHPSPLNNSLRAWGTYWDRMRNRKNPPELLLANEKELIEFWRYSIQTMHDSKVENLWVIAFRGDGDKPFWATFSDAPEGEIERAEVINRMLNIQYELIKEITKDPMPYVRITFYDELSDLLAKGYLKPPTGENVVWTFVAGRRDHYPYDDLVAFNPAQQVKMGYYMNLQFTSTGAHLVQAEGPWKMEFNYRYVNSKSPLYFSVINMGNIREFLLTMTANGKMLWDIERYNTDEFMVEFCKKYFGDKHAKSIAQLYKDYFYSYWEQKKPDFPGGMERQYIFQDLRYARVFNQVARDFFKFHPSPLTDIGFERIKGRSFRIEREDNQVDAILEGMQQTIPKFEAVARRADRIKGELPKNRQVFFNDNLRVHAWFMTNLSSSLYHFMYAYKHQDDKDTCVKNLETSLNLMKKAKANLYETHHGVFNQWYTGDLDSGKFGMDRVMSSLEKLIQDRKKRN